MRKEPTLSYLGSLARTLDEDGRKANRSTGGLSFPLQTTKCRPVDQGSGAGAGTGAGSGPEPMEIGSIQRKPLNQKEIARLRMNKGCFYCRQENARHIAKNCPLKLKRQGNPSGR